MAVEKRQWNVAGRMDRDAEGPRQKKTDGGKVEAHHALCARGSLLLWERGRTSLSDAATREEVGGEGVCSVREASSPGME